MTPTLLYDVRRARSKGELTAALDLRHEVFCDEQGVPASEELDGRDQDAVHLVAVREGELLGTCRLLMVGQTAQFSRLAVAAQVRRRGIATALLGAAEQDARAAAARRLVLHAQTYALTLYESAGYRSRGGRFVEAGIEHVAMEKQLD
ncbi:MAG: GNAT family N-acetyltransferase [Solirubrobacteraceae bacterium]